MIEAFNVVLLEPMLNVLIVLSKTFFGSFGLAIVALTIIVRILMIPVTMKQLGATKRMQALQPRMQELQRKYGKDRQRMGPEMAALYKEAGVSPLGCVWPMLIQFPIWIALYQAVIQALAVSPEGLFGLSQRLYQWEVVQTAVPLGSSFLGMDLGRPNFILAILVAGTMWVVQKMSTTPTTDPRQQSTLNMMQWMMPLMFGFFALSFPSGLSLYWLVSNIISIVMQYYVTGWGTLFAPRPATKLAKAGAAPVSPPALDGGKISDGKPGSKRQNRRRGRRSRARQARAQQGGGGGGDTGKGPFRDPGAGGG